MSIDGFMSLRKFPQNGGQAGYRCCVATADDDGPTRSSRSCRPYLILCQEATFKMVIFVLKGIGRILAMLWRRDGGW